MGGWLMVDWDTTIALWRLPFRGNIGGRYVRDRHRCAGLQL